MLKMLIQKLLFLDFYKACDMLEHNFLIQVTKAWLIKMHHKDFRSVEGSVRIAIIGIVKKKKKTRFEGAKIFDREIKIWQLADNTTLFFFFFLKIRSSCVMPRSGWSFFSRFWFKIEQIQMWVVATSQLRLFCCW